MEQIAEAFSNGEYGATRVALNRDGSSVRLVFGRTAQGGGPAYYGAIMLSAEALQELKAEMLRLGL